LFYVQPLSEASSALSVAQRRVDKLTAILEVAKAMTSHRNLDNLLPLILNEAARVVEAERCTLFILDRDKKELWSRVAQGTQAEIRIPQHSGIAGAVAMSGEVINIPNAYQDPRFNRTFDDLNHFRTVSILCVPMRDAKGQVTGVLQALNAKDGAFDAEDEELLLALGGQAASAIENALLNAEIDGLLEGFVNASVVAIESRDPTTAGHSGRVAKLTVALALATEQAPQARLQGVRFTTTDIREIRYASLLHDFGKVGVRESVLVKANKLHPHQLDSLKTRFDLARKDRQLENYRRRCEQLQAKRTGISESFLAELFAREESALKAQLAELDQAFEFIMQCNRPTVLAEGSFEKLHQFGAFEFSDSQGQLHSLLDEREIAALSITRGSLSREERLEIESHVTHTFRFLSLIPWTKDLQRVPQIAYAHHERLDGKGYPRSLGNDGIPIQSKMMAIADVYDALTASDRPYKKAVPHVKALDILSDEAQKGLLDSDLFEVFVEAQIAQKALGTTI
jgi:HD-GYP domain-containing protein (c-di-GMP phosphodiesterase class II)